MEKTFKPGPKRFVTTDDVDCWMEDDLSHGRTIIPKGTEIKTLDCHFLNSGNLFFCQLDKDHKTVIYIIYKETLKYIQSL